MPGCADAGAVQGDVLRRGIAATGNVRAGPASGSAKAVTSTTGRPDGAVRIALRAATTSRGRSRATTPARRPASSRR